MDDGVDGVLFLDKILENLLEKVNVENTSFVEAHPAFNLLCGELGAEDGLHP
jgi:hypothetical protein